MWLLWTVFSLIFFSLCEVYEKKSSDPNESLSETKLLCWFGAFSLVVATFVSVTGIRESDSGFFTILTENPVLILPTIFYYLALLLAFICMKYTPVSIEAPITNTSGILSFVGAILLFSIRGKYAEIAEEVTAVKLLLVVIVCAVTIIFSVIYHRIIECESSQWNNLNLTKGPFNKNDLFYATAGIVLAALSAMSDAANSVVTYYILDDVVNSYDYLYFTNILSSILGLVAWIYTSLQLKRPYNLFDRSQVDKAIGASLDCAGMVTYIFAVADNPFLAEPIISTYYVFSIWLSHIIFKEKLNMKQYLCIAVIVVCIFLFARLDI